MQATLVKFREAKILSEAGHDIGVQCSADGSWFEFISDLGHHWRDRGVQRTLAEILERYGAGGIDEEYNFIWIH